MHSGDRAPEDLAGFELQVGRPGTNVDEFLFAGLFKYNYPIELVLVHRRSFARLLECRDHLHGIVLEGDGRLGEGAGGKEHLAREGTGHGADGHRLYATTWNRAG